MPADLEIGARVMGYRIDAFLGRGGQGTVYAAEHVLLGRKVALKVLLPDLASDEEFRRRFTQEARLAASLDHPNILDVYDFGDLEGMLFLAVKFVNGEDLGTLIRREGGLSPDRAVRLLSGVADGLDTAHASGLVHRDVKPGNILIEERPGGREREHPYLSDFGLTKSVTTTQEVTGSGPLTRTGYFVGTPEYAAPEQIESKDLDGRTDQYALGCVLYQCLTGRLPFPRDSLGSALVAHMMEPPPRVTDSRSDLSPGIDLVVAKAMSKSKADRFSTCAEMMGSAAQALRGVPGHAIAPPPMPTGPPALSPMPQVPPPPQPVTPSPTPLPPNPLSPSPHPYSPQPQPLPQPPQYTTPGLFPGESAPEPIVKKAKSTFVLGVLGVSLGIFFIGLPCSIIALVQGRPVLAELDRLRTAPRLRSKVNKGIVCAWVGIGLTILSAIAQIVQATGGGS